LCQNGSIFFFRNPCFLSHSIWWKFSLCALDEWDQIPCVVPFAVDECDLVPCAVSTIPPHPIAPQKIEGFAAIVSRLFLFGQNFSVWPFFQLAKI
jgi:hypothetical protein